jgi:hypothetical protein
MWALNEKDEAMVCTFYILMSKVIRSHLRIPGALARSGVYSFSNFVLPGLL